MSLENATATGILNTTPIATLGQIAQDLGVGLVAFRYTYGDVAQRHRDLANEFKNRGIDVAYSLFNLPDLTFLTTMPKPVVIENLNEPYGFDTGGGGAQYGNFRGAWANATAYAVGDVVSVGGYGFYCKLAHTSNANSPVPAFFEDERWINSFVIDCRRLDADIRARLNAVGWSDVGLAGPGLYNTPSTITGSIGSQYTNLNAWIGRLPNAQINNFHIYANFGERFDSSFYIPSFVSADVSVAGTGSPRWLTEFGHSASAANAGGYCSLEHQAESLMGGLFEALLGNFTKACIWTLIEESAATPPIRTPHSELYFGVYDAAAAPKLAALCIQRISALLADANTVTRPIKMTLDETGNRRYVLFQKSNGRYYLAAWYRGASSATPFGNTATTLNGAVTNVATSITVTDASSHPAPPYDLWIESGDTTNREAVTVTAKAGNVLTVTRGVRGTTGKAHNTLVSVERFDNWPGGDYIAPVPLSTTINFGRTFTAFNVFRPLTGAGSTPAGSGASITLNLQRDVQIIEMVP